MDKVIHFEIPADNVERAQKFYGDIFGWHINPMPEMDYIIFHTGPTNDRDGMVKESGFINGGMPQRNDVVKNPVITIEVGDIEKTSEKIIANGGKMLKGKASVGKMGYTAYFEDSEGNTIGLWQMA